MKNPSCSFAKLPNSEVPLLFLPAFTSSFLLSNAFILSFARPLWYQPLRTHQAHVITNPLFAVTDHAIKSKLLSPSVKVLTFPSMTSHPYLPLTLTLLRPSVSQTFLHLCLCTCCSLQLHTEPSASPPEMWSKSFPLRALVAEAGYQMTASHPSIPQSYSSARIICISGGHSH